MAGVRGLDELWQRALTGRTDRTIQGAPVPHRPERTGQRGRNSFRRWEGPRPDRRQHGVRMNPAAGGPVNRVRAAVVQAAPTLFDTPRTLQKLADLTADAARRGADLVVF